MRSPRHRQAQPIIDALVACVHMDGDALAIERFDGWSTDDWSTLLRLAASHQVRGHIYRRFKTLKFLDHLPPSVIESLQANYMAQTAHGLRLQSDMRHIARALATVDVPLIALKGIFLAPVVYGNVAVRPMSDIDIMVPRECIERVDEALLRAGFRPQNPDGVAVDLEIKRHLGALVSPHGTAVEVHWSLTHPDRQWHVDPAEFWRDIVPFQRAGTNVWALDPENLLLHLCLHISYQHQFVFGLGPSCDIAATIAHYGAAFRWDVFIARATEWNWQRGVFLALRLAVDLVGAAVPQSVLDQLQPATHDEHIIQAAHAQLFVERTINDAVPMPVVRAWQERGTAARLAAIRPRIVPSRDALARQYGVAPQSPWLYAYYPIHILRLARRYGRLMWNLAREKDVATVVNRRNVLQDWLAGG